MICQPTWQEIISRKNIATVLTAVGVLSENGWHLSIGNAASALRSVKTTTGLRGRWDVLQERPLIVADVAHNPAGLAAVMQDWETVKAAEKHIITGFVRDKDVHTALALFPRDAVYHFCAADMPRALPAAELAAIATDLGLKGTVYSSVGDALQNTRATMRAEDALLITGSFFIVGEAMQAAGISV